MHSNSYAQNSKPFFFGAKLYNIAMQNKLDKKHNAKALRNYAMYILHKSDPELFTIANLMRLFPKKDGSFLKPWTVHEILARQKARIEKAQPPAYYIKKFNRKKRK